MVLWTDHGGIFLPLHIPRVSSEDDGFRRDWVQTERDVRVGDMDTLRSLLLLDLGPK